MCVGVLSAALVRTAQGTSGLPGVGAASPSCLHPVQAPRAAQWDQPPLRLTREAPLVGGAVLT